MDVRLGGGGGQEFLLAAFLDTEGFESSSSCKQLALKGRVGSGSRALLSRPSHHVTLIGPLPASPLVGDAYSRMQMSARGCLMTKCGSAVRAAS